MADRWRYIFQHETFWNMSDHTMKTTTYQVYIYLNIKNKSHEIHNPECKYLTSNQ